MGQLSGHDARSELEIGIILARWRSLAGGFAAHSALIAFLAVGTIVGSVFGTRRLWLNLLEGLAKLQSLNLTLIQRAGP